MSKTYSNAPDADTTVERIRDRHHDHLEDVTVKCLFVFDLEATEPVLTHQGYPAAAQVRITPLRERALGIDDAVIVIDRATWMTLSQRQRDALVDHELYHLERVLDEETERPVFDALERPKLAMRKHDRHFGWFDEIAKRHGDASFEVRQAKQIIEATGQLYFDFEQAEAA